ncbi:unnamed protein product, partial [Effrenium voratum]
FGYDCSTCGRGDAATSTVKVDMEAMSRRVEEDARRFAEEARRTEERRKLAEEEAARAEQERKMREREEQRKEQERQAQLRRDREEQEREARRRAQEAEQKEREERQKEVQAFLKLHGFTAVSGAKKSFMSSTYPLHKAAELGDAHMVDQLLKSGATATQKNSSGRTPAQVAAKKDRKGSHSAVLSVLTQTQATAVGGA